MASPRLDRPRPGRPLLDAELVALGPADPLGLLPPLARLLAHRRRPRRSSEGPLPADAESRRLRGSLSRIGPGLVALRVDQRPDAELVLSRRGGLYDPRVCAPLDGELLDGDAGGLRDGGARGNPASAAEIGPGPAVQTHARPSSRDVRRRLPHAAFRSSAGRISFSPSSGPPSTA